MSPPAAARRQGRLPRGRSRRRGASGRNRVGAIALTLALGLGAGYLVANADKIADTIREVTLPLRHDDIIRQQAADKGVSADLIAAVIYTESRFRDQTSGAGARGLMQITPETAHEIEKLSGGRTFRLRDLADPDINIRYGTFYLHHLIERFGGNEIAALAAYNAGPAAVQEWGGSELETGDIPLEETSGYVDDVLDKRDDYRDHYAEELGLAEPEGD